VLGRRPLGVTTHCYSLAYRTVIENPATLNL